MRSEGRALTSLRVPGPSWVRPPRQQRGSSEKTSTNGHVADEEELRAPDCFQLATGPILRGLRKGAGTRFRRRLRGSGLHGVVDELPCPFHQVGVQGLW